MEFAFQFFIELIDNFIETFSKKNLSLDEEFVSNAVVKPIDIDRGFVSSNGESVRLVGFGEKISISSILFTGVIVKQ